MTKISILYDLFTQWVHLTSEKYIHDNPTAAFFNINIGGNGFIGDDTGAVFFEFDTLQDGIIQLRGEQE